MIIPYENKEKITINIFMCVKNQLIIKSKILKSI